MSTLNNKMIKGIGVDIVEVSRIKKALMIEGFKEKTFTEKEIENCHGSEEAYYAKRFAAKEAVFKATSFIGSYDLRKIEILNEENGMPYVVMDDFFKENGVNSIHLSLSDELEYAIAYCVVE